jgi:hypothetical protein
MRKDDQTVLKAIKAQNRGSHLEAAKLFQDAANQERLPSEKDELWKAAQKARKTYFSD